jgi:hypothetical protein
MTNSQRIAHWLMLAWLAASAPTVAEQSQNYSAKPPFSAETFWHKALALLNEREGYVTRERFEKAFGVRLQPVQFHEPNMMPYELRAEINWYFTTRITIFSDKFTDLIEPYTNGVHSDWGLYWSEDAFGDPQKRECLTVARVQADLLNSGWSSPWNLNPRGVRVSHTCPVRTGCLTHVLEPMVPPSHNVGRQSDLHTGRWGQLPFGQFFGTGESPNSCVTGFYIRGRP